MSALLEDVVKRLMAQDMGKYHPPPNALFLSRH
jgi:hypothetical protein